MLHSTLHLLKRRQPSFAADQIRKQQQAEYRTSIDSRVRDASAAYMRGVDFPNAPTQTDFLAAYGVREGNLRYTEFRNTQIAGQYIGSFRNMPTSSIQAAVENLKPDTGETGEGYADRAQTYDAVVSAASTVLAQRKADPVQFSLSAGQTQPIDMTNENSFGKTIALRASQAGELAKSYGTPLTFFPRMKPIRSALSSAMRPCHSSLHIWTLSGKAQVADRFICRRFSRLALTHHQQQSLGS